VVSERLAALRELMARRGIDAYIVPSGDAHASEYVADYFRAREWLSGFTGSAGLLIVLRKEAGLWTDGRYFIQAERELPAEIKLFKTGEPDVQKYQAFLAEKLPYGGKVGFDGRTLTAVEFFGIKETLKEKKISFAYTEDLIGEIWRDRPPLPKEKAFEHALKFAGKSAKEKLADVRQKMKEKKIAAYLLTALDSVAWLLNIRGRDVPNLPVVYAFALITERDAFVFIDREKISAIDGFIFHDYDALPNYLKNFSSQKIFYNPVKTNVLLAESIQNAGNLKPAEEIVPLLKAVKSKTELANIKNAFVKEGVAMTKMLFWLDSAIKSERVTEGDVVRVMQKFRAEQELYLGDSFATIAAYGENAAQAHYSCGEVGATLALDGFLLIDTGGQYLDGTTDTTRTICLGEPTDEMKRDFTLVLKGHIALARAVFLKGTIGSALDILARLPLWESGQNFQHGTGHGIGYCLSVHEGPHNISQHYNAVPLSPGMLVTNEPALYKKSYGIRTENVLVVCEKEKTPDGEFFSFENLTLCPIDTRAIDFDLLTDIEKNWLENYHARVLEVLSPYLNAQEREWLYANR
jgi:Xaa-Pro aminopeptidase